MCHSNDFTKDVEDVGLVAGAATGADALAGGALFGDAAVGAGADALAGGGTVAGGTGAATDLGALSGAGTVGGADATALGATGATGITATDLGATGDLSGAATTFGADSAVAPAAAAAPITPVAGAPDASLSLDNLMGTPDMGALNGVGTDTAPAVDNAVTDANGNPLQGPGTPAASSQGGTGNASIDSALKQLGVLGKSASQYAPLAGLGVSAMANKKAQSAASSLNGVAAPALDTSNQLLSQFKTGQLNAADSYAIQNMVQQQTASIKQYYASAGLSNSSMEAEALNQIGVQAQAMREQALQNMLSQGLQSAGVAQGPQIAAVQASVAADNELSQASSNFMAALAKMNTSNTPAQKTGG